MLLLTSDYVDLIRALIKVAEEHGVKDDIRIHYKTGRTNSKIRSEMTKCFHPRLRRIESYVECPDCRRRSYSQGDYEHLSMPPIEF